jgi:hypothetical protein
MHIKIHSMIRDHTMYAYMTYIFHCYQYRYILDA